MSRVAVGLVATLLAACHGGQATVDGGASGDPRPCDPARVALVADEGAGHVPFGTDVQYRSNPPASGPHWPSPHPWGAFDETIPRPWWVHNLEHGGIVFLYNCPGVSTDGGAPDGGAWPCPSITDALRQLTSERSLDSFGEIRVLATGDPLLPKRIGAVAWDWVYLADDLDVPALRCFRDARYGRGPESAP